MLDLVWLEPTFRTTNCQFNVHPCYYTARGALFCATRHPFHQHRTPLPTSDAAPNPTQLSSIFHPTAVGSSGMIINLNLNATTHKLQARYLWHLKVCSRRCARAGKSVDFFPTHTSKISDATSVTFPLLPGAAYINIHCA